MSKLEFKAGWMRESGFSQQGVGDGVSCRVSEGTQWGLVVTTVHGAESA